ncbi:hypothetical protein TWF730_007095 [Orbilia blumenaviensis]|uniref:Uncharacterized protein n=1 Tax=Orbilia blumenaviensis TaxID=1796055 RepID=A0AAV9VG84_9PEZI
MQLSLRCAPPTEEEIRRSKPLERVTLRCAPPEQDREETEREGEEEEEENEDEDKEEEEEELEETEEPAGRAGLAPARKRRPRSDGPGKVVYFPNTKLVRFELRLTEKQVSLAEKELSKFRLNKAPTSQMAESINLGIEALRGLVQNEARKLLSGNVPDNIIEDIVGHVSSAGQIGAWSSAFQVNAVYRSEGNKRRKMPLEKLEVLALLCATGNDDLLPEIVSSLKCLVALTLSEIDKRVAIPAKYLLKLGVGKEKAGSSSCSGPGAEARDDDDDIVMEDAAVAPTLTTSELGGHSRVIALLIQKYCPELTTFCIEKGLSCESTPGRGRRNRHREANVVVTTIPPGFMKWTTQGKGRNRCQALKAAGQQMLNRLRAHS